MAGSRASRPNDPDRRVTILDAALAVITQVGVHKATHRRIAAAAEVPLGSLTYYFDSLEDLLGQAFVRLVDLKSKQFRAAMEGAATPDEATEAVVDLVCGSAYASPEDMNLIFEMYAYAHHNPVVCAAAGEWVRRSRASLALHYRDEVCAAVNVVIEGWPMHRAFLGADPDRRIVAANVELLVNGLSARVRPAGAARPASPEAAREVSRGG